MIYLENKTELQGVVVPISVKDPMMDGQLYRFILFNTVNLAKSVDEILRIGDFNNDYNFDFAHLAEPVVSPGGQFYMFTLELPEDMASGSYEYLFIGGDKVLSRGNAIVGDFKSTDIQYENETTEYKQYE